MILITVILKVIGVLFFCCLVFAAWCAIWWLIKELGKREIKRENEYYLKYKEIQNLIRDWPVTLINHDALLIMLNELKNMKHKNPEKTKVLRDNFYWKYRTIAKQRANKPCECSMEPVFKI